MEFNGTIATKLERLKSLLATGTLTNREVKTEIGDIMRDLQANGLSDEMIRGRVSP